MYIYIYMHVCMYIYRERDLWRVARRLSHACPNHFGRMYKRTWLWNRRNRVHIERHFELMLNPTSYMKMMAYIGFKIKQYVCMYVCMHVCTYACVYVCTCTKKSGRIRVRLQREISWETANTYRGVYVYIYVCIGMHTCILIFIYKYI